MVYLKYRRKNALGDSLRICKRRKNRSYHQKINWNETVQMRSNTHTHSNPFGWFGLVETVHPLATRN